MARRFPFAAGFTLMISLAALGCSVMTRTSPPSAANAAERRLIAANSSSELQERAGTKIASQSSVKIYRHPRGFTFQYPTDWRVDERGEFTQLVPPGTNEEVESYRILVEQVPLSASDPRFSQELDSLMTQLNPTMTRTGGGRPFKAGGGPNALFTWEGQNQKDGSDLHMRAFVVTIKDHAVMLFAAGSRGRVAAREAVLREIASTFALSRGGQGGEQAIKAPPEDRSSLAQQWMQRLSGKKLTMMSRYSSGSAGGYTSRTEIYLLNDGSFRFSSNTSGAVGVDGASGSFGGRQSGAGRWRIYAQDGVAFLEMRYDSGEVEASPVSYENGGTYLNGRRVYVTDPNE